MKKLMIIISLVLASTACNKRGLADQKKVLVYISSGAVQCESDGKSGVQTEQLLTAQKITVSSTQCGVLSNVALVAVCGGITMNINIHQINAFDLVKAETLGFANVDMLKNKENAGYEVLDCNK